MSLSKTEFISVFNVIFSFFLFKEQRTSKRTAYTEYCPFGVRRVSYEMAGVENKDQNTEDKQPISMRDILPKASFLSKAESPKRQGSSALVKTEPPELSDIRQVVSCVSDRSIYPNCETPPPIDRMVYNSPMKVEAEKSVKSEPPENVVYTQCVRPDIGPDGLRLLSSGVPYLKTLNYKDRSYVEGLISSRCSDEKANEENLSSRRFSPNTATKTETVHDSEEKQYVSSCESSRNRDFIYKTEPITSSYVRDAVTVSRLSTLVRPISSVLPPSSYTDNLSRRQYSENEPYTKDAKETAVLPRDIRTRSEHVKSEAYHNGHVSPCDDATNEDSKTRILSPERGSDDDRKSRILSPERSSDDSGHESDKDDTIIIRPREQPQYWHDEGSRTVETKDPNCRLPCCSQMDFKVERESFSPIKIPARRAVPAHIRPELYSREEPFHDSNHSAFSVIRPGQKRPDEEGLESVRQGSAIKVRVIQSNSPPPNRTVQDVAPKNGENGGTITTTSLLESVLSHKADLLRNAELGLTGGITNARYPYHTVHASSDLFTIPPPQPPAVQCSTIDSTENGLLGLTRVANEQLGKLKFACFSSCDPSS